MNQDVTQRNPVESPSPRMERVFSGYFICCACGAQFECVRIPQRLLRCDCDETLTPYEAAR